MILLAQNSSKPKKVKNFKLNGYPKGVVVLSMTGNNFEVRINLIESGFVLPFSLSKNRKMIKKSVAKTNMI